MSHIVIKSEDEGDDFFSDSNEEEDSEFDDDEWDDWEAPENDEDQVCSSLVS